MAEYEARERIRSEQNTPLKSREQNASRDGEEARDQQADEADAVGALMGMSGS